MGEEACFAKPGRDWLPRLIVIDGCNIGRSACGIGREAVNCAGLMAVIRWLLVRDFDVVAFLPVIYNNSHNYNVVHVHLLTKLEELGLVTFTPARTGRGDRKAFINYDDLYVTTLAARHGGCVLSGDKFKDILAQPAYSEFHPVILNRTLDVKFHFLPYDVVYHKLDVFYKALPELFICCMNITTLFLPSLWLHFTYSAVRNNRLYIELNIMISTANSIIPVRE
uniref:RNase_Zc3h12a domain-containing protein n=1 Tax=Angiostrongylus cantonensis TaxID=6313 RepID=A0A158P6B8_ANGCA